MIPTFEGDEAQVRQSHQDKLRQCDAIIIHWGKGNELWLQMKLKDLEKIPGYGRSKPMLAQAIYFGEPQTNQKQRFHTQQALLINNSAGAFLENSLELFLTQVAGK